MNSNSVAAEPAKSVPRMETKVEFDPIQLRAPFFLRCGAAAIDYLILLVIPVMGLLVARLLGNDGSKLVNSELNNFAWLISFLVSLCNLVLLPMVCGQSIGKIVTGLKIVSIDGHSASFGKVIFRQTFGYLLTFLTGFVGFLLSVFSRRGRALHDIISGTIVVFGDGRIR